jgi:hypothetical protein
MADNNTPNTTLADFIFETMDGNDNVTQTTQTTTVPINYCCMCGCECDYQSQTCGVCPRRIFYHY